MMIIELQNFIKVNLLQLVIIFTILYILYIYYSRFYYKKIKNNNINFQGIGIMKQYITGFYLRNNM